MARQLKEDNSAVQTMLGLQLFETSSQIFLALLELEAKGASELQRKHLAFEANNLAEELMTRSIKKAGNIFKAQEE